MALLAAKQVALGTGKEDPDRPGREEVKVYEAGEEVDVSNVENVQALIDNGYLVDDSVEEPETEEGEGGEDE